MYVEDVREREDWFRPSIGTEESGNGGLFGGVGFAAFRLSKTNMRIIRSQEWYGFLENVRDPKLMDRDAVIFLAQNIKNLFAEDRDYLILNMSVDEYNDLFAKCEEESLAKRRAEKRGLGPAELLLDKIHRKMYERLNQCPGEEELPRRIDDFRNIDEEDSDYSKRGEERHLSVSIAAILATETYLRQLHRIREVLSANIRNRHNHSLSPKKLNDVFDRLENSGHTLEFIYSRYCKRDRLKIYKSNLKNHQKQN